MIYLSINNYIKMNFGTCKLCHNETRLSIEHVPPRSCGNKVRYNNASILDFMTSEDPLSYPFKGKVFQGGIGYNSYCNNCNTFLGNEYVRNYKEWFNVGLDLIQDSNNKGFDFTALRQNPLRLLKQVLGMFVAINPISSLVNNPELINFLNNPESKKCPKEIRVFCYLNNGPRLRYLELNQKGNFKSGKIVLGSEITFPPFGYVLVLNNDDFSNDLLTEITGFSHFGANNDYHLSLKMNKLDTCLPIILDYRSRDEIEKKIAKIN